MKRLPTIFVTSASLVVFCASVLGFAASAFWFFDLFNHFRLQFFAASILGIVVAIMLRLKRAAWIFTLAALINATLITPLFLKPPDQPGFSRELSIVSYNTWIHNGDWSSVLPILQEGDPDIVYFTEAHPNILKGVYEHKSEFHIFQQKSDILLVRRRAKLNPKLITTSASQNIAGIPVKLSVEGLELTFLGIHPPAPLSSAHSKSRDQSFAAIASFLKNHSSPKIVVGDFNATPWSRPFKILQEQTGLVNFQKGFGIQATWPSYPGSWWNWLARIPIDHCLHSPSLHTIDRKVGESGQSNHNPIFIRLGIQTDSEKEQEPTSRSRRLDREL